MSPFFLNLATRIKKSKKVYFFDNALAWALSGFIRTGWERSSVSEIDLVISTRGLTIPVEIKYSQTWDKKYLHAIRVFKENHRGKNLEISFSLVIYRGDFMALDENVYAISAWAFA